MNKGIQYSLALGERLVKALADGEGHTSHSHTTPLCEDYSSTTSWSPFPDKGRLNVTRFVVLCIFYLFIYDY